MAMMLCVQAAQFNDKHVKWKWETGNGKHTGNLPRGEWKRWVVQLYHRQRQQQQSDNDDKRTVDDRSLISITAKWLHDEHFTCLLSASLGKDEDDDDDEDWKWAAFS